MAPEAEEGAEGELTQKNFWATVQGALRPGGYYSRRSGDGRLWHCGAEAAL
ncbi:Pyruvate decarboxylase; Alpha-keto-acid decarboxylase [Klebsiella pneumoniae IS46]|nr:Pyruvate decarboxylase; Alpha-keto-acid decarboxylase [Klebsiella pneumoniae IS46]